jgi:hypothetical protein
MVNNNRLAGNLPRHPNTALRQLDRLIGTWTQEGEYNGVSKYQWMEGGFFFIHEFDAVTPQRQHVKGVEYVSFDEETHTLRSQLMGIGGHNFTYAWEIEDDNWTVWFGDKGSKNLFRGRFDQGGNVVIGGWQWPMGSATGGFRFTSTRTSLVADR